jgi:hypothetical protein
LHLLIQFLVKVIVKVNKKNEKGILISRFQRTGEFGRLGVILVSFGNMALFLAINPLFAISA